MSDQGRRFKLGTGLEQLEEWAGQARQSQKNVLYKALFAVIDGSVFNHYDVLRDALNSWEFFVLIREEIVLKICYTDATSFGILYIGPLKDAPGLDLAADVA